MAEVDPDDYQDKSHDAVRHPSHYDLPAPMPVVQCIDAIFAAGWGEAFCKGNALKYMTRAGKKDSVTELEDTKKARTYINFWINYLETGHPRRVET